MDSAGVKAFFEQVSTQWDHMLSSFYSADVIDALAEHGRVTSTARVVDVGTGTGFVAAGLAGRAASVVGVDNSPAMLGVAADNLAALGATNVTLADGEVDQLPLPDDSVDVAVANMVLHHAPEPAAMLAEMARVVRPGGTIAITDEIEHHYEWMRTEQADLWLGFTPDQVRGYCEQARLVEYGYSSLGMQ
ncbi:MAG: class I SAM-dependent methyltransferase [Mycobacteriaceae bacterium]